MEIALPKLPEAAVIPTWGQGSLLGLLPELRVDPIGVFRQTLRESSDVVRLKIGVKTLLLFKSPAQVQHILVDNAKNYSKQMRHYEMLRLALGNGLVTSDGSFWLRQRRLAQPAFHRARIAAFAEAMTRAADDMVKSWEPAIAKGETLEIAGEMMAVTLRVVCETLLGTEAADRHVVGDAISTAMHYIDERTDAIVPLPMALPTPKNLRFKRAMAALDEIVFRIIAERRAAGDCHERSDVLSMFMAVTDEEGGGGMTDQQLRDEVMTMFVAGHETTANLLTWTAYLLSVHPDVEQKLRGEIDGVLQGRLPKLEDLKKMPLLERVLKESLRLYPPAWIIGRAAIEDDVVDGVPVKAGTWVLTSPFITQRHPRYWANPEGFDPDRWLPEAAQGRPRFAFFPFSGGPRQCIGDTFAMMEAQIIMATVLSRVRLSLAPWQRIDLDPMVTLRPKYGMSMVPSRVS